MKVEGSTGRGKGVITENHDFGANSQTSKILTLVGFEKDIMNISLAKMREGDARLGGFKFKWEEGG